MSDFDDLFMPQKPQPYQGNGNIVRDVSDQSAWDQSAWDQSAWDSSQITGHNLPIDLEEFEVLVHRVVSEVVAQLQPWLQTRQVQRLDPMPMPIDPIQPTPTFDPNTLVEMTDLTPDPIAALTDLQQLPNLEPSVEMLKASRSADQEKMNALQGQIDILQLREEKLHQQLQNYETEMEQLHKEKELLEQTILELPEIYRRKFLQRMEPIRERIEQVQAENYQLRVDIHELNCQLRQQKHLEELDPPRWQIKFPSLPGLKRRPSPQVES